MRRTIILLLACVSLTVSACAGSTVRRVEHAALCVYHGHAAFRDIRRHHPFWTVFQIDRTIANCGRALR